MRNRSGRPVSKGRAAVRENGMTKGLKKNYGCNDKRIQKNRKIISLVVEGISAPDIAYRDVNHIIRHIYQSNSREFDRMSWF